VLPLHPQIAVCAVHGLPPRAMMMRSDRLLANALSPYTSPGCDGSTASNSLGESLANSRCVVDLVTAPQSALAEVVNWVAPRCLRRPGTS
jgi:hypothetical protein